MHNNNKIGFWGVFGIVTGSQIGSGFFTLPIFLAPYGIFGVLGCLCSGVGAMVLALIFALLCAKLPRTGGPHVYVKHAWGNNVAFFVGWTYWVISWVSTIVVVITSVGYLSPLLNLLWRESPRLQQYNREIYLFLELTLLWLIAWFNFKGVKFVGNFLFTLLKFVPLIILPLLALRHFNWNNFQIAPNLTHLSPLRLCGQAILLALWGFIGLETGTTPADSVKNPGVNIPRATILGTLSVALLYALNFIGIMGLIPSSELMQSNAPYVAVAEHIFSGNWYLIISLFTFIVCVGTLNSWILTSGQISLGLALDGFMPKIFKVLNKNNVPTYGIGFSCLGIVPFLFLIYKNSLIDQINQILDLSVVSFLGVYLLCILSLAKMLYQDQQRSWIHCCIVMVALLFCGWVFYETSLKTLLLASLFMFSGIPLYIFRWYHDTKDNLSKIV